MAHFLWNIVDLFQTEGRGVVVTGYVRECDDCADVPDGYVLHVRRPDK